MIWVTVEKEPTNELSWEDVQPRGRDVATVVDAHLAGKNLDTGWVVTEVTA